MAEGQGFEPRSAESESAVLPLDDPPANKPGNYTKIKIIVKSKYDFFDYNG